MTVFRRTAPQCLAAAALIALSAAAGAREIRMQGPNGDGGACPTVAAETESAPAGTAAKRPAGHRTGKAKATPSARGGGDAGDATARPRWHSFLPGMFR